MDEMRERLTRYPRRVWRHRWSAIGTAWTVCLIGWAGTLLLPNGGAPLALSSAGEERTAVVASPAPTDERPSPAAALARQLRDNRENAATLQADLDAALALRAVHAGQLTEIPRMLDAQVNPIHRRRAIQLDQQDDLIATLHRRLATLQAQIDDLESRLRSPAGRAPPTFADQPPVANSAASRPPVAAAGGARLVALCGVLIVAITLGAATAFWQGQRAGIVDHPSDLRHRAALPVLCTITVPHSLGREQRERAGRNRAVLACLGLLGLFAALVVADGRGLLARLGDGLPGGWPG